MTRREPTLSSIDDGISDTAPAHEQRLHMLRYLAPYSALLLVVGDAGSGKTALLDEFVAHAHPTWQACRIGANAMMDTDALLSAICSGFGVPAGKFRGHEAQLRALTKRLLDMQTGGQRPMLAIDDADQLPETALTLLADLIEATKNDGGALGIVLFCQPQLETMLATPTLIPLRQHLAHTFYLPGAPGTNAASGKTSDIGKKTLWLAAATIVVALAVLLAQRTINTSLDGRGNASATAQNSGVPLAIPPEHPELSEKQKEAALAQLADVSVQAKEAGLGSNNVPAQTASALAVTDAPSPSEDAPAPLSATAPATRMDQPSSPTGEPAPQPKEKNTATSSAALKDASWLLAQNSDHYTLQLMAMKNEATVRDFAVSHKLPAETAYFQINRSGGMLHVLITGIYSSRPQAEQAAKDIPALAGITPWLRKVGDVQKDIQKANQ
ncbi:MAG: AAA family ATPase [Gammaproteobacteria bacterium]|nr:AAA family ATPase [Gammaproteobacteria bacterium]